MPQSEIAATKRRLYAAGQGSTGSGKSAPGAHTKFDPTNHAVIGEPGGEYRNANAESENPIASQNRQGFLQRIGLSVPNAGPGDTSVAALSGEGHPHFTEATELKGVANQLASLSSIFANMLVELAAQRAAMPLTLEAPPQTYAGKNTDIYFLLDQMRVPSLNTLIYNNTGATIFVAISEPATAFDIPILAGGNMPLNDIKLDFISIYTVAAQNISRQHGVAKQGNSIIIYGWGNPEWRHFSGQV